MIVCRVSPADLTQFDAKSSSGIRNRSVALRRREWPISFGASGYVALYRLQQDVALVVAVRHQKEVGYQPS